MGELISFSQGFTDLPGFFQTLSFLPLLAQFPVGDADIVVGCGHIGMFLPEDIPKDVERFQLVLQRLLMLAQIPVGVADIVEGGCHIGVFLPEDIPKDVERFLFVLQRLLMLAQIHGQTE